MKTVLVEISQFSLFELFLYAINYPELPKRALQSKSSQINPRRKSCPCNLLSMLISTQPFDYFGGSNQDRENEITQISSALNWL
jgi:hypothetical protein